MTGLISFPAHALLVVEERLREQGREGELARRILIAARMTAREA